MIAKLKGTVDTINEDSLIIDVSGVGYFVYVSAKIRESASTGSAIEIRTMHIFRQEQQILCGFYDAEEEGLFKALLDVPGIGIKSAMAVLSVLSAQDVAMAVANQDVSTICRVPGIGKKTAERILLEMKDKSITKIKDVYSSDKSSCINDAILGLISLGYQKVSIMKTINDVSTKLGPSASANDLIIHCLKDLK